MPTLTCFIFFYHFVALLQITLPRVTSFEAGEPCPFSLKGTIHVIKSHDVQTTLTGWASQTRFTPDVFEYHLHAVVASMDQVRPCRVHWSL